MVEPMPENPNVPGRPFLGGEPIGTPSPDDDQSQFTSLSEEVFELIQEGVAVLGPDLSVQIANPSFRRLLGIDMSIQAKPSLADHPLAACEIIDGEESRTLAQALRDMLLTGNRLTATNVEVKSPGSETVERFCVQAKRRQSSPGKPMRILLWVRPSEEQLMFESVATQNSIALELGTPGAPKSEDAQTLVQALDLVTDFNRLCVEVLDMALRVSGGGSGSLMLLQENGRELAIVASRGLSDPIVQKTRTQIGEGIAGRVAETGEALLLPGRVGDKRFRGTGGRPEVCSSVCVPIKAESVVLGVLNVNSTDTGEAFDESTRDRTASFASQLGAVLRHSQQFQAMRARSTQLTIRAEIEAVAFTDDDMDKKLGRIASSIDRLISVDSLMIYLVEAERETLNLAASAGSHVVSKTQVSVPFGAGVPGWVAKHGKPVTMTGQVDGSDRGVIGLTTIGVPIRHSDETIAVIVFENSVGEDEVTDLHEIATPIAAAIGHVIRDAEAQDESKRKLTVLSALSEIGLAMTESPDSSSFAKLTAYCATTLLESDVALVRLAQGSVSRKTMKSSDLGLQATHGMSSPGQDHPMTALEEILIDNVIVTGEVKQDVDLPESEMRIMMENADVRSAVCIPMMSGDSLIGTITLFGVGASQGPVAREHEAEIGERFGDYAAAAARRFILLAS